MGPEAKDIMNDFSFKKICFWVFDEGSKNKQSQY